MKNLLLLSALFSLGFVQAVSQPVRTVRTPLPVSNNVPNVAVPHRGQATEGMQEGSTAGPVNHRNGEPPLSMYELILGNTTYDMQTNASGTNRIYQQGGHIGVAWTYSTAIGPPFPDRGTMYSYFDGLNWNPAASAVDTMAWPNIDIGALNTEYLLGHKNTNPTNTLALLRRTPAGSGAWTEFNVPAHPSGQPVIWARMRVGGSNGSTVHVIATINGTDAGMNMPLVYSRSQDGGVTWDQQHIYLPWVDSLHYADMAADAYAIDVRGNTVAIVSGYLYNDWILWKSTDNGTTWTRTVIKQFPIPAYDYMTMTTDTNGDAVADTIDFLDGSMAVLIDNQDDVHSWCGALRVIQEIPGVGGISYFKYSDGLYYWNQNISGGPYIIAASEDIDLNGIVDVPDGVHGYNLSMTGMPSAGVDGNSNIVLAYSSVIEWTTNGNPDPSLEEAFRNVYVMLSQDNGITWSTPIRLEPDDFTERVFPAIPRNLGSELDLTYMQDIEPGLSVGGIDPISVNDIIYYHEYFSVIFPGVVLPPNLFSVTGHVYYDSNQNGVEDGGDFNMTQFPLQVMPDAYYAYSNILGNYTLIADTGIVEISPVDTVNWMVTTDSTSYILTLDTAGYSNIDFGVYPANIVYDAEIVLTAGFPRCNNSISFWLNYENYGTTVLSGTVKMVIDSQLDFGSSAPAPTLISGDTLEWSFSNLLPYEQRMIHVYTSSMGLVVGDTITNCAYMNYNNGAGGTIEDDCKTQAISCSYDPNDKAVDPEGIFGAHYVLLTDTLVYTIRFQNTGNDTAFVVRVRDTLNANIDPSSFRLIASSHPVNVTRNPANNLLFEFPNILLPDSNVNEPGSNGFVKYSVRPYNGIPIGTEVENTAYIFFDFNPPVITNTVLNTFVDVLGLNEPAENFRLHIFPNPTGNDAIIVFKNDNSESHEITISDLTGRTVQIHSGITSDRVSIDVKGIQSGIYVCSVNSSSGINKGIGKLVVK